METKSMLPDEMRRGAVYQYRRIAIDTLAGLKEAERLQAQGWKAINGSLFTVLMQKEGTI